MSENSPFWIDTQGGVDSLVERLSAEPIVAVDTEADSYYSYSVKVCLFQFSTPDGDFLVDPLAGLDLSGFGTVFADPDVEIVFHAAENDIGLLRYQYDYRFDGLFDTMLAAQVLGYRRCGLAAMLEEIFDCIESGSPPPTTALWGREAVLVGQAAELAARENRVVLVDDLREGSAFPHATPFSNA